MSDLKVLKSSNIVPILAIIVPIVSAFVAWWVGSYNNSHVKDATLDIRVSHLESEDSRNLNFQDRFLAIENQVRVRTPLVDEHISFRDRISELEKEVSVLEVQIRTLELEGNTSRDDISDLKQTISKIVTLLKGSDAL